MIPVALQKERMMSTLIINYLIFYQTLTVSAISTNRPGRYGCMI